VQREPPSRGFEEVNIAAPNITILMQDFYLPFDFHLLLDKGLYRGWQASTEVGWQGHA
jgi:hypothetical protein